MAKTFEELYNIPSPGTTETTPQEGTQDSQLAAERAAYLAEFAEPQDLFNQIKQFAYKKSKEDPEASTADRMNAIRDEINRLAEPLPEERRKEFLSKMPERGGFVGRALDLGAGLIDAVTDQLPSDVAHIIAGRPDHFEDTTALDKFIAEQDKDRRESPMSLERLAGDNWNKSLYEGVQSVPLQGALFVPGLMAGAVLGTGAAALAAESGPAGMASARVLGQMAGQAAVTGAAFYRLVYDSSARQYRDLLKEQGIKLTDKEWQQELDLIHNDLRAMGIWEAGPEAMSAAISGQLWKSTFRVLPKGARDSIQKNVLDKIAKTSVQTAITTVGKLAENRFIKPMVEVLEENLTEGLTTMGTGGTDFWGGQAAAERRLGLSEEDPTWSETLKDQAGPVTVGALIQSGLFKALSGNPSLDAQRDAKKYYEASKVLDQNGAPATAKVARDKGQEILSEDAKVRAEADRKAAYDAAVEPMQSRLDQIEAELGPRTEREPNDEERDLLGRIESIRQSEADEAVDALMAAGPAPETPAAEPAPETPAPAPAMEAVDKAIGVTPTPEPQEGPVEQASPETPQATPAPAAPVAQGEDVTPAEVPAPTPGVATDDQDIDTAISELEEERDNLLSDYADAQEYEVPGETDPEQASRLQQIQDIEKKLEGAYAKKAATPVAPATPDPEIEAFKGRVLAKHPNAPAEIFQGPDLITVKTKVLDWVTKGQTPTKPNEQNPTPAAPVAQLPTPAETPVVGAQPAPTQTPAAAPEAGTGAGGAVAVDPEIETFKAKVLAKRPDAPAELFQGPDLLSVKANVVGWIEKNPAQPKAPTNETKTQEVKKPGTLQEVATPATKEPAAPKRKRGAPKRQAGEWFKGLTLPQRQRIEAELPGIYALYEEVRAEAERRGLDDNEVARTLDIKINNAARNFDPAKGKGKTLVQYLRSFRSQVYQDVAKQDPRHAAVQEAYKVLQKANLVPIIEAGQVVGVARTGKAAAEEDFALDDDTPILTRDDLSEAGQEAYDNYVKAFQDLAVTRAAVSLDQSTSSEGSGTVGDVIADTAAPVTVADAEAHQLADKVAGIPLEQPLAQVLTPQEVTLLEKLYGKSIDIIDKDRNGKAKRLARSTPAPAVRPETGNKDLPKRVVQPKVSPDAGRANRWSRALNSLDKARTTFEKWLAPFERVGLSAANTFTAPDQINWEDAAEAFGSEENAHAHLDLAANDPFVVAYDDNGDLWFHFNPALVDTIPAERLELILDEETEHGAAISSILKLKDNTPGAEDIGFHQFMRDYSQGVVNELADMGITREQISQAYYGKSGKPLNDISAAMEGIRMLRQRQRGLKANEDLRYGPKITALINALYDAFRNFVFPEGSRVKQLMDDLAALRGDVALQEAEDFNTLAEKGAAFDVSNVEVPVFSDDLMSLMMEDGVIETPGDPEGGLRAAPEDAEAARRAGVMVRHLLSPKGNPNLSLAEVMAWAKAQKGIPVSVIAATPKAYEDYKRGSVQEPVPADKPVAAPAAGTVSSGSPVRDVRVPLGSERAGTDSRTTGAGPSRAPSTVDIVTAEVGEAPDASIPVTSSVAQLEQAGWPEGRPHPVLRNPESVPPIVGHVMPGKYKGINPVQLDGVNLILERHSKKKKTKDNAFLLADATGFGKTRQLLVSAIEIAQRDGAPALIILPNRNIIEGFWRQARAMGLDLSKLPVEFATYIDVRKSFLARGGAPRPYHKDKRYSVVVADEAHNLKDPASQQSRGLRGIDTGFHIFSTATPTDTPEGGVYFLSMITGQSLEDVATSLGYEVTTRPDPDDRRYNIHTFSQSKADKTDREVFNSRVTRALEARMQAATRNGAYIRREYPFWGIAGVREVDVMSPAAVEAQRKISEYWGAWPRSEAPNDDVADTNLHNGLNKEGVPINVRAMRAIAKAQMYRELRSHTQLLKASLVSKELIARYNAEPTTQFVVVVEGVNYQTAYALGMVKADETGNGIGQMPSDTMYMRAKLSAAGIPFVEILGGDATTNQFAMDSFQKGTARVVLMTAKSGGAGIDLDDQRGNAPRHTYVLTADYSANVSNQVAGRTSRASTLSPATLQVLVDFNAESDTHSNGIRMSKEAVLHSVQAALRPAEGRVIHGSMLINYENMTEEQKQAWASTYLPVGTVVEAPKAPDKVDPRPAWTALYERGLQDKRHDGPMTAQQLEDYTKLITDAVEEGVQDALLHDTTVSELMEEFKTDRVQILESLLGDAYNVLPASISNNLAELKVAETAIAWALVRRTPGNEDFSFEDEEGGLRAAPEVQVPVGKATDMFQALDRTLIDSDLVTLNRAIKDSPLMKNTKVSLQKLGRYKAPARFEPDTNTIVFDPQYLEKGRPEPVLALHEGVHAITFNTIWAWQNAPETLTVEQQAAVAELNRVYRKAKEAVFGSGLAAFEREVKARGRSLSSEKEEYYGFFDLYEFASEALTSKEFQELLAAIPDVRVSLPGSKGTLWDAFRAAIKRMLGIKNDMSALSTATDAVIDVIQSGEKGGVPEALLTTEAPNAKRKFPKTSPWTPDPINLDPFSGRPTRIGGLNPVLTKGGESGRADVARADAVRSGVAKFIAGANLLIPEDAVIARLLDDNRFYEQGKAFMAPEEVAALDAWRQATPHFSASQIGEWVGNPDYAEVTTAWDKAIKSAGVVAAPAERAELLKKAFFANTQALCAKYKLDQTAFDKMPTAKGISSLRLSLLSNVFSKGAKDGGRWVHLSTGAEASAFRNGGSVYKILHGTGFGKVGKTAASVFEAAEHSIIGKDGQYYTAFSMDALREKVGPENWTADEDVVVMDKQLWTAGSEGVSIVDYLSNLNGQVAGLLAQEVHGIVPGGGLIIKQSLVEGRPLTREDIIQWAQRHNGKLIPNILVADFNSKAGENPVVINTISGPMILLDLRASNGVVDDEGRILIYDKVFYKLSPEDIKNSPVLRPKPMPAVDPEGGLRAAPEVVSGPTPSTPLKNAVTNIATRAKRSIVKEVIPAFKKEGLLPQVVFGLKEDMQGAKSATEVRMEFTVKKFQKAVKAAYGKSYGSLDTETVSRLNNALNPTVPPRPPSPLRGAFETPEEYEQALKAHEQELYAWRQAKAEILAKAYQGIPQNVVEVLIEMRGHIDALSKELLATGAIAGELVGVIRDNLGIYVTRSYRVFDDPKWAENVLTNPSMRFLVDNARAFMKEEMAKTNPKVTDQEVQSLLESWLDSWSRDGGGLMSMGKLGARDLSILLKRKDIAEPIRALMGEYTTPIVNYTRSLTKMTALLAQHRFLTHTQAVGMGRFLFREPTGAHVSRIAPETRPGRYSPLSGLYTTPEINMALEEFSKIDQPGWITRWIQNWNAVSKTSKTVFSALTQMRNLLGQPFFWLMNGHYDVTQLSAAIRHAGNMLVGSGTAAQQAYLERLAKLGLLESAQVAELAKTLEEAHITQAELDVFVERSISQTFKRKVLGPLAKLYAVSDQLGKIYGFENERATLAKAYPEKTAEALDRMAADRIKNTYPTYSRVPALIAKILRRQPFLGPFMTFAWEVFRTTGHSILYAVSDLRSTNPVLRRAGAKRMAGIIATASVTYTAGMLSRAILGISAEDEEDMRKYLPYWNRNSQFLYLGKGDGELSTWNLSYLNPYSYLTDPIIALEAVAGSGDPAKMGWRFLTELMAPFISPQLGMGKILNFGERDPVGRRIYNPQSPWSQQAVDIFAYFAESIEPGTATRIRRRWLPAMGLESTLDNIPVVEQMLGWAGVSTSMKDIPFVGMIPTSAPGVRAPDEGYRVPMNPAAEVAAEVTGQRWETFSFRQALEFKTRDFNKALDDADEIFTMTMAKAAERRPDELVDAYKASDKARFRVIADFHDIVAAAVRNGVAPGEVDAILESKRVPEAMRKQVLMGFYEPWSLYDGRAKSKLRESVARALRAPSMKEAIPQIRQYEISVGRVRLE